MWQQICDIWCEKDFISCRCFSYEGARNWCTALLNNRSFSFPPALPHSDCASLKSNSVTKVAHTMTSRSHGMIKWVILGSLPLCVNMLLWFSLWTTDINSDKPGTLIFIWYRYCFLHLFSPVHYYGIHLSTIVFPSWQFLSFTWQAHYKRTSMQWQLH